MLNTYLLTERIKYHKKKREYLREKIRVGGDCFGLVGQIQFLQDDISGDP